LEGNVSRGTKTTPMKTEICSVKDHLVSGKFFSVMWDETAQIAKTEPAPKEHEMHSYYDSDEYISHNHSSKSLVNFLYGFVQKLMFRVKKDMFKKHLSDSYSVLDYGCGVGGFLKYLSKENVEANGIETNSNARSLAKQQGLFVYNSWNEAPNKKHDLITLWHVFEHISNLKESILEFDKRLNKEGVLLIAVPNLKSYDASYYNEFWAAYDVPRHLWHFSQDGIISLLDQEGFMLVDKRPLIMDALYISYVSEKYKGSRFPLIKGVYRGIHSNLKAVSSGEYSSLVYLFKKKN
jgi:2-polyprenyl-3-methyl-5-hydroxy-6-metoxy-1,4-benzoquinol methylase